MRILILSHYFTPEPVPKPAELAHDLAQNGHEVTVVSGFPSYPTDRVYAGYRQRPVRRDRVDGLPVFRTYKYPYQDRRMIGRAMNYSSFALSSLLALPQLPEVDVIYVWHPPITTGASATIMSRWLRAPFVYDVQDIWPESLIDAAGFRDGPVMRSLHRLERFIYRRATRVITPTEPARQHLIGKGVPAEKVVTLAHWIDAAPWTPPASAAEARAATRSAQGWSDDFVCMFAGNIGVVQGLDTVIAAIGAIDARERVRLVLVGDGSDRDRLEADARAAGLGARVTFLPRRPQAEMPPLLHAADALLVPLKPSALARWSVPTKTPAYLASGTPLIVAADGPAADLVRDAQAGMIAPPGDAAALAGAIRALAALPPDARAAMGERGRAVVQAQFTRERLFPQYERVLIDAAASGQGRR